MSTNNDILYKDKDEMWCCKVCKLRIKHRSVHIKSNKHQKNLNKQPEENQTIIVDIDSIVEIVESDKEEELIEVKLPKKKFKIVIERNYDIFQSKIEKYLENGWKLHGYTQHPFEVSRPRADKTAHKGQWSQAFTKNVF
tara:strand:- start:4 stop:420 length:417 start_codon:yes stop_codon:yes gene_type:complete